MATDSDKPTVEITDKSVTAKVPLKWVVAIAAAFTLGGGLPTITSVLNGVSREQFGRHEERQAVKDSENGKRFRLNEDAIIEISKSLVNLETLTRNQIAEESARQLTAKIKNPDERMELFIKIYKINVSRLSKNAHSGTCYNLDCKE